MLSGWLASKLAAPIAIGAALLLMLATATLGVKLWVANHDLAAASARADTAEKNFATAKVNGAASEVALNGVRADLAQMTVDAKTRDLARQAADAQINATLGRTTAALAAVKPGPDKCASASALIKDFAK